ncbi:MAG: membrane-binding protein [Flavobacterium sp.]|jgi:antitoxin component YwqK of YwqJK toxin-antitoxin module|nr:membrane-binding protein [Flavobacterium sp.]
MKKFMIIGAVLISSMIFAQKGTPKLEVVDNMVKATYYYDNGKIQQEGFFKDGKLEGKWIAYDAQGNKLSVGEYSNGQKTGKWFFYNEAKLSQVDYTNNQVAYVTTN